MRNPTLSELSNRAATSGGEPSQPGPHGAPDTQRAHLISSPASSSLGRSNSERLRAAPSFIPLPSGLIVSPVTALKSLTLTQALIDGLAVVFGFLFLCALAGSLPLAVALMVLGVL